MPETPSTSKDAASPARRIGLYEITHSLGRGGMGSVYRAIHTQTGRHVAIKTVRGISAGAHAGIRREIAALARLHHPRIVRIVDNGLDAGVPWYAMDLVGGTTLRDAMSAEAAATTPTQIGEGDTSGTAGGSAGRNGREFAGMLPLLTVVRRLCDPLAYLHGEGVVHRDLKPDNVLVREPRVPSLVDFGITAQYPGRRSRDVLEVDLMRAGTASYMAPELFSGEPVDARTDLYALGCVLYEIVTCRPPFHGSNYSDLARMHVLNEPERPSVATPDLPKALEELILQLLAKRREDRVGHTAQIAAVLDGIGATEHPETVGPRPRAYLFKPRLAGRERELASARAALADGDAPFITAIAGESGIGKTRLLSEIAHGVDTGRFLMLAGSCGSFGTGRGREPPLGPLRAPLAGVVDQCRERGDHTTARVFGERAAALVPFVPALAALPGARLASPAAELPPDAARRRLFDYLATTLEEFAGPHLLLLLLDDMQWADELTVGFLNYLSSTRRAHPLRVLAGYRTGETDVLEALLAAETTTTIPVSRVDREAVDQIVGDMLGTSATPRTLAMFVSDRCDGNPYFAAEYLRTMVVQEILTRDDRGYWCIEGHSVEHERDAERYNRLPLPDALAELTDHRLSQLSALALDLAYCAAVIGRETEPELLQRVASVDAEAMWAAVAECSSREVLQQTGEAQLAFPHDHVWQATYDRIPGSRKTALHRATAEVLERIAAADTAPVAAAIGYHWERAGNADSARCRYLEAARFAITRFSAVEADRHYRAYLALVTRPTAESISARIELSRDALIVRGLQREAVAEAAVAVREARAAGESLILGRALEALSFAHWRLSEVEESERAAEEAVSVLADGTDPDAYARSLLRLASIAWRRGSLEGARAHCERALEICTAAGLSLGAANCLQNLGAILLVEHRYDDARVVLERAEQVIRPYAPHRHLGNVLGNLGLALRALGEIERACDVMLEAEHVLTRVGDLFHANNVVVNRAVDTRLADGDYGRARALLDEVEVVAGRLGDPVTAFHALCERCHLALAEGTDAIPLLEQVRAFAAEHDVRPESDLGDMLARVERACARRLDGGYLFRGECVEDLPDGLARWLESNGQLTRGQSLTADH